MFYMLWLFLYYKQVCGVKHLFYNGNPKYLLLTLFGMDGYMSYRYTPNYYFIGEWFLGALILLYLCYPLLTWCMEHAKILTTLVLLGGFASLYLPTFYDLKRTEPDHLPGSLSGSVCFLSATAPSLQNGSL